MIPASDTRLILEAEIGGARAWAERHHASLTWLHERLELQVQLTQRSTTDHFYLLGKFENYRAIPPIWAFVDASFGGSLNDARNYPKPAPQSLCGASMFIEHQSGGVICAPFNRLAYGESGGPHADWGTSAGWLNTGGGFVRATTLGDMLQAIFRDFHLSDGRMRK